jgi:predicted NAD-dependent protein-ADP-ribosyltransferase YbiA (DUF1768 family)
MVEIINSFTPPDHLYLSSFYNKCPIYDKNGIPFKMVHQAFIAEMTPLVHIKKEISLLNKPVDIIAFGKSIQKDHHTEEWQILTMKNINIKKFIEYPILMEKLRSTGSTPLVNTLLYQDMFWGVYKDRGENHLGKILMEIRSRLS